MIYASSAPADEYPTMLKRSSDPERLTRLGKWRVSNDIAIELISGIGRLPLPKVRFTGQDPDGNRAKYVYDDKTIVYPPNPRVGTVVHELAHHEHRLASKHEIKGRAQHGWNFTEHLDRLAAKAELWLWERNGHADE